MIDHVAEKQAMLKKASTDGSLSNEQKLRAEIAKFQEGFHENKPSVIEVSSSAERMFAADMANLRALLEETKDPVIRRMLGTIVRSFEFLARGVEACR